MKIIDKKYVPIVEAKDILKESKRELYEQKLAYEYAKQFSKLKPDKAKELIEKLNSLGISKLKEEMIIKIVDILPSSIDELRTILTTSELTFKADEINKIYDVVKEYVK